MNTGRFRTKLKCLYIKQQSLDDLIKNNSFPCGLSVENDNVLIERYKNSINRDVEKLPYLEKKKCLVQKREGLRKKTTFIQQNIPPVTDVAISAALSNF